MGLSNDHQACIDQHKYREDMLIKEFIHRVEY